MQAAFSGCLLFKVMNMETTHCTADAKHIRHFLNACNGNWHNCIYVTCIGCQTPGLCKEPGFLFHPNQTAAPLILPLSDARILFPRYPEATECLCSITAEQFRIMYRDFLEEQHFPSSYCPCIALLKAQENACYDW